MLSWLPENASASGQEIDALFYVIYYITGAVFLLVSGTLLVFLVRYRHRPGRPARYSHGNTTLEMVWTVIPALILVILTIVSIPAWNRIKMQTPATDLVIRVTGKQFNWEILYPGPDGAFGTADDLELSNEMHVPTGKPVILRIRSKDVIHSFFVPNLRFKQDAVPGREITAWFEASRPGKYETPCAELCGFGHSGMKGWHTPEEYANWVKEQWP